MHLCQARQKQKLHKGWWRCQQMYKYKYKTVKLYPKMNFIFAWINNLTVG